MIDDLKSGLLNFMEEKGFTNLNDMVGKCLGTFAEHDALDRKIKMVSSIDRAACIRDNACYIACRDGGYHAISLGGDGPVIDEEKCRGCGVCLSVCPVGGCMALKRA